MLLNELWECLIIINICFYVLFLIRFSQVYKFGPSQNRFPFLIFWRTIKSQPHLPTEVFTEHLVCAWEPGAALSIQYMASNTRIPSGSQIESQVHHFWSRSIQKMTQMFGSLALTWEMQRKILAPCFCLAQPW